MAALTLQDRTALSVPIILLGSTGCGKSSFVNAVLGEQVAAVGVGMEPATEAIAEYPAPVLDRGSTRLQGVLVDTQGFGCNHQDHRWEGMTDLGILQEVEKYLLEKFKNETEQGQFGVIYFYNKCAPEVDWEKERRTLAVFTKLAGGHSLPNLAVVTMSPHPEPSSAVETGLLKELRDRGIQPICSSCFGDVHVAHPQCGDVRTPPQIIEYAVSLVLSSKTEVYDSDDSSDDEGSIYSTGFPEEERDHGLCGDGWGEQPHNDDDAFFNPITYVHIAGGIFNDVRGNQTNNYGHPHASQAPERQRSQQCPNDPREASQPDLDVPRSPSQPDLNDPHHSLQQNPGNPTKPSRQSLDNLQPALQETPNDQQQHISQDASDGPQEIPNDPQQTLQQKPDDPGEASQQKLDDPQQDSQESPSDGQQQISQDTPDDPQETSQKTSMDPDGTLQAELVDPCEISQSNLEDPRQALHEAARSDSTDGSEERSGRSPSPEKVGKPRICTPMLDCVVM
ncbi:hypothetical protein BKA70DRAFT_688442 [Coprinopsis sp. MPI-PUGE-AT-0042]|nr:hypothetical protein BKA70DRAFT_688442 [Coprinopsis sp. MPI-PUGE-AT-0042]